MIAKEGRNACRESLLAERDSVLRAFLAGGLGVETLNLFREAVYRHYRTEGRRFQWRETREPYRILVSEFMLQQTQVERVREKYPEFLKAFPDFRTLAGASLREVLSRWQGLGYNRRAKSLQETARTVMVRHGGRLPSSREELLELPGVGAATAGALAAFAFNQPVAFVETNIRRVYLHFFFPREASVGDARLLPLIERSLDRRSPRSWYYALMDYGSMLRRYVRNPNRKSAHYRRQSPFEGSDRQIRSGVLRELVSSPGLTLPELARKTGSDFTRAEKIVEGLRREGFLLLCKGKYHIP